MTFFLVQVWLWDVVWSFFWSNHWAGHQQLSYKIYFSSCGMVYCCCIEYEKTTLEKDFFFKFVVSSWGSHLLSFFTFPISFKSQTTIEWSTLSSRATSHVVVRGSALIMALNWSLSTSNDQPLCSSPPRLISFAKLLEPLLHCTFISSSWAKCVVDVASCLCCFAIHFELK